MPNPDVPVYQTRAPRVTTIDGVQVREDVLFTDEKGEPDERRQRRATEALST